MCEDAYYKKVNQNSFKKNNKRSKRCVITKEEKKKNLAYNLTTNSLSTNTHTMLFHIETHKLHKSISFTHMTIQIPSILVLMREKKKKSTALVWCLE